MGVDVRSPIVMLAAAVAVGLVTAAPLAQTPGWRVDAGDVTVTCPLTIGGSFQARSRALTGELTRSAGDPAALDGTLQVDLSTLDTGISLRNSHLRERYLEVQRGDGFARAVLSQIALGGPVETVSGRTTFTGSFAVHGVTRPVSGTAELTRVGDGVRVEATFPVVLPDHQIPKPRYLGVGVEDEVQVRVTFTAGDGGSRPAGPRQETRQER